MITLCCLAAKLSSGLTTAGSGCALLAPAAIALVAILVVFNQQWLGKARQRIKLLPGYG